MKTLSRNRAGSSKQRGAATIEYSLMLVFAVLMTTSTMLSTARRINQNLNTFVIRLGGGSDEGIGDPEVIPDQD